MDYSYLVLGDIVSVSGTMDGITFENNIGKVICINIDGNLVGIEFNKQISLNSYNMHSCDGRGKFGYCWYFYVEYNNLNNYRIDLIHGIIEF